ncbi:MAG: pyridoxal-phosphate dependent enzyme, partial [Victivallales bacterium]|nr:pyridoxal-phosphate dependent enzyme [Victivallales bacterium]
MKIFNNISETVGNTPVVKLNRINSSKSNIFAKLEFFNPTSSVKDRIAVNMINEAEKAGLLQPGGAIIEPTSGNTGLGLAMTAASRGYRLIITMPETMSVERQRLMKQLGAEIILTDGSKGMNGAIKMAEKIAEERSAFMPQQFNNFSNPEIHYKTTGPEIWEVSEGEIDIFVAGIGTGGT